MKKFKGWVLIIFCSIFLLIFAITLFVTIPGLWSQNTEFQMSNTEILSTSLGFLVVITLLIFGLKNGIKKVKKDRPIEIIEYDKTLNISLTGQIDYPDYRNLIFGLSFKKPIYLFVLGMMLLILLSFLVNRENMVDQLDSNYFILIFIGVTLLSPIFMLIQIKRIYKTNKILQEQLHYTLTNESINIKGNTIDSTQRLF